MELSKWWGVHMFGRVDELAIVLVIVLVLFGGKKLPELSKSIGQSVKEVRNGFRGDTEAPTVKPVAAASETSALPVAKPVKPARARG
jgi:sec-independent protein translocase protein TatA